MLLTRARVFHVSLPPPRQEVTAVAFSGDGLALAVCTPTAVFLYDSRAVAAGDTAAATKTYVTQPIYVMWGPRDTPAARQLLVITADNRLLRGSLRAHDATLQAALQEMGGCAPDLAHAAAWSPTGTHVALASAEGPLLVLCAADNPSTGGASTCIRLPLDCEADAVRWTGPSQLMVTVRLSEDDDEEADSEDEGEEEVAKLWVVEWDGPVGAAAAARIVQVREAPLNCMPHADKPRDKSIHFASNGSHSSYRRMRFQ
jgi:hypothetical protein